MSNYNHNQLLAADAIDGIKVGKTLTLSNGVRVKRESPTRFVIDGRVMCFIEAVMLAVKGIE